jgi:hypothetical protein
MEKRRRCATRRRLVGRPGRHARHPVARQRANASRVGRNRSRPRRGGLLRRRLRRAGSWRFGLVTDRQLQSRRDGPRSRRHRRDIRQPTADARRRRTGRRHEPSRCRRRLPQCQRAGARQYRALYRACGCVAPAVIHAAAARRFPVARRSRRRDPALPPSSGTRVRAGSPDSQPAVRRRRQIPLALGSSLSGVAARPGTPPYAFFGQRTQAEAADAAHTRGRFGDRH